MRTKKYRGLIDIRGINIRLYEKGVKNMKFLDGVKTGFGITVGSIAGLYVSAVVIGLASKSTNKESEKSDNTTESEGVLMGFSFCFQNNCNIYI